MKAQQVGRLVNWVLWSFVLILLVIAFGCASSGPQLDNTLGASGSPRWVEIGSKSLKTKTSRVFHGVGSAADMGDFARQTIIADRHAKMELSKTLNSFMEIVSRDYTASEKMMDQSFIHQTAANDINNITQVNMPAVRIIGHWRNPASDMIYSIAELDMSHVQSQLEGMHLSDDAFKGFLRAEAENIFDRIARRDEE